MLIESVAQTSSLETPARNAAQLPRWIRILLLLLLVACFVMMFIGAVVVGTTWDEQAQVVQLQTFLQQGWHMGPDALINGVPDPTFMYGSFVYGPVGELIPHLVNVILGNETLHTVSSTASAFAGRHIGTALFAVAGVAAAGLTIRVLTRSWAWALLGATLLAVTPLWLGHGMFNIKDTPVASGYTIATLGLVCLTQVQYFARPAFRALGLLAIVLGTVLAAGTRTVTGLPIAASLVFTLICMWLLELRRGRDCARDFRVVRRFLEGLGALCLAYGALVLIYPKAYVNPYELGMTAVKQSLSFPWNEAQLTNGVWMLQPVSWSYLPLWFGAQLPLLIIVGFLLFSVFWLRDSIRFLTKQKPSGEVSGFVGGSIPLLLQALLLPVGGLIGHSIMYNGTRHMLAVVPAVAILSALGLSRVMNTPLLIRSRRLSLVAWISAALGVVFPFAAQTQLFPYNYSYFNAAAVTQGIDGRWATDYWRAGGRELIRRLPDQGQESCGTEQLAKGEIFPCLSQPMFSTYAAERGIDAKPGFIDQNHYWFIRENSGILTLPAGCRPFDTVTRQLFWETITIGQIGICDFRVDVGRIDYANPTIRVD